MVFLRGGLEGECPPRILCLWAACGGKAAAVHLDSLVNGVGLRLLSLRVDWIDKEGFEGSNPSSRTICQQSESAAGRHILLMQSWRGGRRTNAALARDLQLR